MILTITKISHANGRPGAALTDQYLIQYAGKTIATVYGDERIARVLAASYDMLHALEMVRDANKDEPHIPPMAMATINAAIIRALGAATTKNNAPRAT